MLAEELLALEYTLAPTGASQIVAKDDLKKRLGQSPESGDAVSAGLSVTMPSRSNPAVIRPLVV